MNRSCSGYPHDAYSTKEDPYPDGPIQHPIRIRCDRIQEPRLYFSRRSAFPCEWTAADIHEFLDEMNRRSYQGTPHP